MSGKCQGIFSVPGWRVVKLHLYVYVCDCVCLFDDKEELCCSGESFVITPRCLIVDTVVNGQQVPCAY